VNQLVRDPVIRIKELGAEADSDVYIQAFTKIFGLDQAFQVGPTKKVSRFKIKRLSSYANIPVAADPKPLESVTSGGRT
jgi:hypothetical protein